MPLTAGQPFGSHWLDIGIDPGLGQRDLKRTESQMTALVDILRLEMPRRLPSHGLDGCRRPFSMAPNTAPAIVSTPSSPVRTLEAGGRTNGEAPNKQPSVINEQLGLVDYAGCVTGEYWAGEVGTVKGHGQCRKRIR